MLKTKIGLAAAAFVALGFAVATPAQASHIAQRCGADGCYRVRCTDDGSRCVRTSSYYKSEYRPDYAASFKDGPYYHHDARYLCDSDGENCRWSNSYSDTDGL